MHIRASELSTHCINDLSHSVKSLHESFLIQNPLGLDFAWYSARVSTAFSLRSLQALFGNSRPTVLYKTLQLPHFDLQTEAIHVRTSVSLAKCARE